MEVATEAEKAEVGRRIKAARAYAGLTSAKALADKIDDVGYSREAIVKWETGNYKRGLGRTRLETIARACGLSVIFFALDFSPLSELDADEQRILDRRLRRTDSPSEEEEPGSQTEEGG
ncbi:MAG: Helix-turn-helix domain [Gaiellales bacterium]|nr:Helix-turn-helix domain [Gaiellales bacterium]